MSEPKRLNPWHNFFLLCRYKVQEVVRVIQSIDQHYELGLVGGRDLSLSVIQSAVIFN